MRKPRASGCHHPPIGLLVVSGDLGPAPLAVWDGAQGHAGGHRPQQTMWMYNPDAIRRRRRSE